MDLARYAELAMPFLEKAGITWPTWESLEKVLTIVKPKVKLLKDLPEWVGYFFTEEFSFDEAAVTKSLTGPLAVERLSALRDAYSALTTWDLASLEAALKETATKLGAKVGELVHPARVAASGRSVGPGLYEMLEVLGKERTLTRFEKGIFKAGA